MSIQTIIKNVENQGPYTVLDIYDFDNSSYLVVCENSKTKSRMGDFYFIVDKFTEKVSGYNPAVDPFEYGAKIRKAKVVYSR